uniref:HORMA domain-containing protein n=1 Tax=Timema monikensis TaxID=170555 RepID=A0A7R9HVP9_9NEOP|nr:unnamed protein product [Timema monikensis]
MSHVPHTIHGGDPLYTNAGLTDPPADALTCSLVTLAHTLDTSSSEKVAAYLLDKEEDRENKERGQEFMLKKLVKQVSMVIIRMDTHDPIERWDFTIEYENEELNETCPKDKSLIQKEICNVLRQISASISYLPLLDTPCSFDLHLDTFPGTEVPNDWESITKCKISNGQDLKFSTFSTSFHKIDTAVVYKAND